MAFLRNIFGKERNQNARIVHSSFDVIVEAARRVPLYRDFAVPDTPIGRFESLSAHLVLVLLRYEALGEKADGLAVEVTEQFFQDVDHSIRELGIGDAGVPKRMKKLASMFYGRMEAYEKAIKTADKAAFALALGRNLYPTETSRGKAIEQNIDQARINALAEALMRDHVFLSEQSNQSFLSGAFAFTNLDEQHG